jgi:hypothetical protein
MNRIVGFAISLIVMESAAYGQVNLPAPPEKKWTESQPLYAPYTGPGFGNPSETQGQSVGRARKEYNDASGTPAYSRGGNPEATQLGEKPRKPKNKSRKPDAAPQQAPSGDDKR